MMSDAGITNDARSIRDELPRQAIRRWSAIMVVVCSIAPLLLIVGAIYQAVTITAGQAAMGLGVAHVDLDGGRRIGLIAATSLPVLAIAYGLLRLRGAFRQFVTGALFSVAAIRGLRDFALAAMVSTLLSIMTTPIMGIMLTYGSARGTSMPIRFGSDQLMILLVAGVVWVFASIMTTAADLDRRNQDLARENDSYV